MTPAIDPLGPLWPTLDPDRQSFLIEMANSLIASSMFGRPEGEVPTDADIDGLLRAVANVRGRPGMDAAERWRETESAILRRMMLAILDGTAPPEVDRPELRHHVQAKQLVIAVARHDMGEGDDPAEVVRAVATLLHAKITPEFDLERVIADAIEHMSGEADS